MQRPTQHLHSRHLRKHGALGALLLLVLAIVGGGIAAGCAEAARSRLLIDEAGPMSVAFIVHGAEGDPFWEDVRKGAEDAAKSFDVNLFWRSTPDTEERVRLVNEVIQQQLRRARRDPLRS